MSHPIGSAAPLRDSSRFDEGGWVINETFARSDASRDDDKNGSVEKSRFAKAERNSALRNLRGRSIVSQLATMTNDASYFTTHTCVRDHLCACLCVRDTNRVYEKIGKFREREAGKNDISTLM